MARLEGKVAIVTGAGAGNGRAIARAFAQEGARVVIGDVDEASAQESAALIGERAVALRADVSTALDCRRLVESAVERFGALHILVNNAGIWRSGTVEETSEEDWDALMAVNVKGVFLCSKFAVPAIAAAGGGSIIHLCSLAGIAATAGSVLYTASKHAVAGMTKAMALDHARQGIRVNALCPGLIDTALAQAIYAMAGPGREQEMKGRYARATPLGRVGQPEDVAKIAVHLASDEAAWVTGMLYSVDGGVGIAPRR
jgi:meso-butanediol dehydrogenase/(S,S)-butanediol dehydrogenase/diacetyl reductase